MPTAAARYSPAASAAHGVGAFERVAAEAGLAAVATPAMVVDEASAADPDIAARLADADLVYFPGGDPDLIPLVLRGSAAWAAIIRAHAGGAVLGGASAGAMAMAPWTWTPDGGDDRVSGSSRASRSARTPTPRRGRPWPSGSGRARRPASVSSASRNARPRSRTIPSADPILWRVVGEGEVRWQATRGGPTARHATGRHVHDPAVTPR